MDASGERLWQKTPLIRSSALSAKTGCEVYLKIETFQTSGSFKGRGVSHFANQATKGYLENRGLLDTSSIKCIGSGSNSWLDTKELASRASAMDSSEWSISCKTSHIPANELPHLIIASGGNAGLAAASAARILGVNATIFLPAAQEGIKHLFLRHNSGLDGGAKIEVRIGGENYFAALKAAEKFAEELGERGILVPAYDDPLVWQGNSTLIQEIAEQLPYRATPDALLCSVGGAGLIAGLMVGCEVIPDWERSVMDLQFLVFVFVGRAVPIVGVETSGASCFYDSVLANRSSHLTDTVNRGHSNSLQPSLPPGSRVEREYVGDPFVGLLRDRGTEVKGSRSHDSAHGGVNIVHVGSITSRATSLGASSPAAAAVAMALQRRGPVKVVKVSDERAMLASLRFAEDHLVITELACSATLVPAYTPSLLRCLLLSSTTHSTAATAPVAVSTNGSIHAHTNGITHDDGAESSTKKPVIVFVVCGGSKGSPQELQEFEALVGRWSQQDDEIWVDGERISL